MSKEKETKTFDIMDEPVVMNAETKVFHPANRRYRSNKCSISEIKRTHRKRIASGYEAAETGKQCSNCYEVVE